MKVRSDFVTNSSSSSFILGGPEEIQQSVKSAKKYLENIQSMLGLDEKIVVEHIVDLKYNPDKEYDSSDISFVCEAIMWYDWKTNLPENEAVEYVGLVTDEGEWFEVDMFNENYTKPQIKAIFDYAHRHYGEMLIGNTERPFYPIEVYDQIVADPHVTFKCNHMG